MIEAVLLRLQAWALLALGVLAALAGAYSVGARKAAEAERAKINAKAAQAAKVRHDVENEVARDTRGAGAAADRLRDDWSRD